MLNKFNIFFEIATQKMGKLNGLEKLVLLTHYVQARIFVGADKTDFFEFKLYEKNLWGKNRYVSEKRLMSFAKQVNNQQDRVVFKNKAKFNALFAEYVNRKSLDMKVATEEDFLCFVSGKKSFFVKPINGLCGKGAYVQEIHPDTVVRDLYKELAGREIIVEELVQQNSKMASFNETSVNTIRIVTFVGADGKPFILEGAALRTGRAGRDADNFHHGGVGAKIDIETGIVCTKGVDKAGLRYVKHPDSGTVFLGFQIPLWEDICKTVKEAALVVPSVRYVGWDVAITNDDRIIFIEGNDEASPDLAQMSDGVGLWHTFKMHMDEIKALKEGS